jgi:enterochelin esterase family protein
MIGGKLMNGLSVVVPSLALFLFVAVSPTRGADFSGKYEGAWESSNGGRIPVTATIRQEGNRASGRVGPNAERQDALEIAIENGHLIASMTALGGLRITFVAEGERLSGTVQRVDGRPPTFERLTLTRTGALSLADTISTLQNEGKFRSERILKLRDQLRRRPEALDEFWKSVEQSGAPIIEPDPSDERFQMATFLWRGKPDHRNVLIMWGPYAAARPADFLMAHLPDTDLWFRTIRLPRGARLRYQLSPNDPLAAMPPLEEPRKPSKDPLNKNGDLLELPNALTQPYYQRRDGTPLMAKQERRLSSRHLSQERQIVVYTPPGYDMKAKPLPSIYFFDGEDADGAVFASWTFENLIADGKIPPMVVVRIVNPAQGGRRQLMAAEPFFNFLANELVPYVRANYNVSSNADETAVAGYSLGGLAATYAGLRHFDVFGLVLSQSGSFWYEPSGDENVEPTWLARQFIASPKLPLRFYICRFLRGRYVRPWRWNSASESTFA